MQDPKFENQVQQKMEELQFAPSDAVWKNVEAGLDREKKRRVPIFWLFLLGGLFLSGGIYFISTSGNTKKIISFEEKNTSNQQKENKKDAVASVHKSEIKKEENTNTEIQPQKKNGAVEVGNANPQQLNHTKQTTSMYRKDVAGPSVYSKTKNEISSSKEKKRSNSSRREDVNNDNEVATNVPPKNANQSSSVINKKGLINNEKENTADVSNNPSSSKNPTIDVENKKNETAINKKETKTDSTVDNKIAKSSKQKKKTSSWQVGFNVNPGVSNISQGLLKTGYAGNSVSYALAAPVTPLAYYNNSPSSINPGFSFDAGAFLSKKISDRIKISAGLNYHYYSTHITVGKYVDTLRVIYSAITNASYFAGGYYQGNKNLSNYTTHYHFAELPVLLGVQLNNLRSKFPVMWEAGLSLSYLVNTNALQYDEYSGAYYKNNSFFNRMQLSASTGLMVGFHIKKSVVQAGPQVQYGLTHLLNKNAANPEHLLFGGIKLVFMRSEK